MFQSRIPYEINRRMLELTFALYRVTETLSNDDELRARMRLKANETFEAVLEYGYSHDIERELRLIIQKIEALKGYLRIGQGLRVANPVNFSVLEREYEALGNFLRRELDVVMRQNAKPRHSGMEISEKKQTEEIVSVQNENTPEVVKTPRVVKPSKGSKNGMGTRSDGQGINQRQQQIIEYLREKTQAKVPDLTGMFSSISAKTIQRDLQDLVEKSILQKSGNKRWTIYTIKDIS